MTTENSYQVSQPGDYDFILADGRILRVTLTEARDGVLTTAFGGHLDMRPQGYGSAKLKVTPEGRRPLVGADGYGHV